MIRIRMQFSIFLLMGTFLILQYTGCGPSTRTHQSKKELLSGVPVAAAYSGFREGQHPDRGDGAANPSDAEILEDLQILAKNSNFPLIRLYDSNENSESVLRIIHDNNIDMKVMLGIWLDAEVSNTLPPWGYEPIPPEVLQQNKLKNEQQVEKGIRLANTYSDIVVAVNVGNETLATFSDHTVTIDTLIAYVRKVKDAISQPVTVADFYTAWVLKGAVLAPELDFVAMQTYPAWVGIAIDSALAYTEKTFLEVKKAVSDARIVISEAG